MQKLRRFYSRAPQLIPPKPCLLSTYHHLLVNEISHLPKFVSTVTRYTYMYDRTCYKFRCNNSQIVIFQNEFVH